MKVLLSFCPQPPLVIIHRDLLAPAEGLQPAARLAESLDPVCSVWSSPLAFPPVSRPCWPPQTFPWAFRAHTTISTGPLLLVCASGC